MLTAPAAAPSVVPEPRVGRAPWRCDIDVSSKALALFSRQLATMYRAGIPMLRAVLALSHQCEDPALSFVLLGVLWSLRKGKSISEAMATYPRAFPRLYRALVHEGETQGSLDACLERAAEYMENKERLRHRVRSASAYPLLVLTVGTASGLLALKLMVPFLLELVSGDPATLPLATRVLLWMTAVLQNGWLMGGALLGLALVVWWAAVRLRTPEGRLTRDRLLLRMPVMGDLLLKLALCRVARTLGASLRSGLRFSQTLALCSEVAGSEVLRLDLLRARKALLRGVPLERYFLSKKKLYTPAFSGMVAVGLESGKLDQVAERLADLLEIEAEARLESLLALLQPALMVFLGTFVAFVAMATMMPIYRLL